MIKRIKTISNIGRFKQLSAAPLELGRLTFIYGENALGKSTLADVLACLETHDVSVLESRRTLPATAGEPAVAVGVVAGSGNETTVEYRQGTWRVPADLDFRLAVFDDGFQSRNVFTGRVFERENREQLTTFVLGFEGVALAEEIAAKRDEQARAKRAVASLARDTFRGIADLQAFLALVPDSTAVAVAADLQALDERTAELRTRRKNATKFGERPLPTICEWAPDVLPIAARAASILGSALPDVFQAARESLDAHIARCFKDAEGAEPWIQQGLRQNRGSVCPLCGQALSDGALGLFLAFEGYFSAEYARHEAEVREELPRVVASLEEAAAPRCSSRVEQNDLILGQYIDCDDVSEYREGATRARAAGQALASLESRFRRSVDDYHGELTASVREKALAPMKAVAAPPSGEIERNETALCGAIREYNSAISALDRVIRTLREASTPERLEEEEKRLTRGRDAKALMLRRLELAPQVDEYQRETKRVGELDGEIERLRTRLEEEQSAFLNAYFDRLNRYFKRLGGREFELRRRVDNRGHRPVVSIEVLFRKTRVPDARVEHLFSASDRRALALAVFWARVSGLPEAEVAKTVLVLDDPVTSFDEHRIGAHNETLMKASRAFRQVIALTHFRDQLTRFLRTYATEKPCVLELQRDGETTKLVAGDVEALMATDHELARRRLFEFADGVSDSLDVVSMRVLFEAELEYRFAQQLHANSIRGGTLKERIEKMAAAGILSPEVAQSAHDWRRRLNAENHCLLGATTEDQRSTANELRDFIYFDLSVGHGK